MVCAEAAVKAANTTLKIMQISKEIIENRCQTIINER